MVFSVLLFWKLFLKAVLIQDTTDTYILIYVVVSVGALGPVVSHAEDVEGRVEATGYQDCPHDHQVKVVRDCQQCGQSQ